jgi:hypothetical protein
VSTVDNAYRRYDIAKLSLQVLTVVLVLAALFVLIKVALVNQENGRLLVECTTAPSLREPPVKEPKPSDCYVRTQAQQADVIGVPSGPINEVVVLAAACARQAPNDTEAEIRACVEEGLASR